VIQILKISKLKIQKDLMNQGLRRVGKLIRNQPTLKGCLPKTAINDQRVSNTKGGI
jgi:hypothetical protein